MLRRAGPANGGHILASTEGAWFKSAGFSAWRYELKFSTRARYGMRAMLDLAENSGDKLVLLRDIAERQDISKRYLEHMMTLLRNRGLVVAERGASGGYRLARAPRDIKLDEIFEALEGELAPVDCVRDAAVCERSDDCAVRDLWCEVTAAMRDVLKGQTLADLKKRAERLRPAG
jgi:Rrf2 family transcriptional regulator, cysteine metabolism repressor